MNDSADRNPPAAAADAKRAATVPDGYRQGLITAITVLLGFSLAFVRFWGLEAPGQWTLRSILSTGDSIVAVLLQLVALYRALRLEDQAPAEYRKTVRWFIASAIALLLGVVLAIVETATSEAR